MIWPSATIAMMLPARESGRPLRRQVRELLARTDDFGVAMVMILMTIIVFAAELGPIGEFASVALSGATLLFVMYTSDSRGRAFGIMVGFVAFALVVTSISLALDPGYDATAAGAIGLLLAVIAPIVILRRIILSPRITFRLVLGALAIYLLIGLAYAYVFPVIGAISGQSFFVETSNPGAAEYLYFSYTTLATIGFGDFTAATNLGRMISVSEGLIGQLYLVSAVAVLVGNIGRAILPSGPSAPPGSAVAPNPIDPGVTEVATPPEG